MIKSSRNKKAVTFFYAVSSGRTVGIFDNWTDTSKSVNGFSNNQHCKYDTLDKAVEAMKMVGIHDPNIYFAFHDHPTPYSKLSTEDKHVNQHTAIIDQGPLNIDTSEIYKRRQISITAESMDLDYHTPEYQSEETFVKDIDSEFTLSHLDKIDHEIFFNHHESITETEANNEDLKPELNQLVNNEFMQQVTMKQDMILQQQEKYQLEQKRIEEKLNMLFKEQKHCDCCIGNSNSNSIVQLLNDIQHQQTEISQQHTQEMKHLKQELSHMNYQFECLLSKNEELSDKLETALTSLEDSRAKETMLQNLLKTTSNNNIQLQKICHVLDNQTDRIEAFSKSHCISSNPITSESLQSNSTEGTSENTTKGKIENSFDTNDCQKLSQSDKTAEMEDSQGNRVISSTYKHSLSTPRRNPFSVNTMIDDHDIEEIETEFLLDNAFDKPTKSDLHQKADQETVHKNSIKISPACKNFLVGDSNMKNVSRRRLDHTGNTEIRTFRGATVKTLTSIFEKNQHSLPQVEKVIICIGTNDCSRQSVDGHKVIDDMHKLIVTTKKVFCSAQICIMAIPPQKNPAVNRYIFKINKGLKDEAIKHNITFKECHSLWHYHVTPDGVVDDGILVDKVHLSSFGLSLLLKQVIQFFFGSQINQRINHSMKETSYRSERETEYTSTSSGSSESKDGQHTKEENNTSIPQMFSKLKKSYLTLLKRYVR